MRFNTVVLIVVLAALVAFGAFNFDSLMFPHTTSLFGFGPYRAPLGMILLVTAGALALLFSLLTSLADLRAKADSARLLREMQTLRANLDAQEGTRFAQLQTYLEEQFGTLRASSPAALGDTVSARVDRVRDELSADIGQLEDYLRRRLGE
ncbi:hypothetical protein [Deinococcus pimensis]|uniref:hypothetical protein n=1 Tax=Deinococcus pimensis TaxID=309888 RepID=UPI0004840216|nr:hypothetical protein [Deinococcus pimensis]